MKLCLYYVVQLQSDKSVTYYAGPLKSWGDAWGYIQGVKSVSPEKDLYVGEQNVEVEL